MSRSQVQLVPNPHVLQYAIAEPAALIAELPGLRRSRDVFPLLRRLFDHCLTTPGADWNYSIYDLAWALRADVLPPDRRDQFLDLLERERNDDGTWGLRDYLPHSCVVDTLAALMALHCHGRSLGDLPGTVASIDSALGDARGHLHHDTVAFELIVPMTLDWLRARGLPIALGDGSEAYLAALREKGRRKAAALLSPYGMTAASSLSFSAELLALVELDADQRRRLSLMMLPNGSVGDSPAATAGVIAALREGGESPPEAMYGYLRRTLSAYGEIGLPNLFPASNTILLWTALPWLISRNADEALRADPENLRVFASYYDSLHFGENHTVSWDANNPGLADLDDTSVAYGLHLLLRSFGAAPGEHPVDCLEAFRRRDGSFFCYPHESHPSPASHLHAIMALERALQSSAGEGRSREKIEQYLGSLFHDIEPEGCILAATCHDKWMASWTYGAQRWLSLPIVHARYPAHTLRVLEMVLSKQHEDGGWGESESSLEETAHLVSGLVALLERRKVEVAPSRCQSIRLALRRAGEFMDAEISVPSGHLRIPKLWISKNMYTPLTWLASEVLCGWYSLRRFDEAEGRWDNGS